MAKKDIVYIIGHKNPDTDSICSAICYAYLKNQKGEGYVAARCGDISDETKFVLDYFNAPDPEKVLTVNTQVKDIEIRKVEGVDSMISLKSAWEIMKENKLVTLPIVTDENKLEGLITVSDIAKSYMDIYVSSILADAKTPYKNLVEILNGQMLVGDINETIQYGKVFIAAANPELIEDYIAKDDIVICGDRFEAQLCAIEMQAACVIICCKNSRVSQTIQNLANEKGCKIIKSEYDTYTATRLVNQSMPIRHFMRKHDLITFSPKDLLNDIHPIMAEKRHRDFPVVKKNGELIGMISRRNLIGGKSKRVILVDHNEKSQAVEGLDEAEILEVIDHHRIADFETLHPIFFRNQPLGCTATIITQMFDEQGVEIPPNIAGLLCSAIISDTVIFSSPTCTPVDKATANRLALIANIDIDEYAKQMFKAGSDIINKSTDRIFYQDFKMFHAGKVSFGIGQFYLMDSTDVPAVKDRLYNYMERVKEEKEADMMFFMLTSIFEKSSKVIFCGENSYEYISAAFHQPEEDNMIFIPDFVSRKKQFLPSILSVIHSDE